MSGLKSFDQFKSSLVPSGSATAKSLQISSRQQPSYTNSSGSFANLKLNAEKMVKEQASAKTDLDLANSMLKELSEHIHSLEEMMQNTHNDDAKLKGKHIEDEKPWKGLKSKIFSTKTLLQLLSDHFQDAEKDIVLFANKLSETSVALDNLRQQFKSLSLKLESSEETIRNRDKELEELGNKYETEKQESINLEKKKAEKAVADMEKKCEQKLLECKEEIKQQLLKIEREHAALVAKIPMQLKELRDEHLKVLNLTNDKDNLIKNFEETEAANESHIESLNSILNELQLEITSKEDRLNYMYKLNARKEIENTHLIAANKELTESLDKTMQENYSLENCVKWLTFKLQEKAENELKEKTKLLKNKDEAELRELRSQHEEERKVFEEELNIQKNKRRKTRWT